MEDLIGLVKRNTTYADITCEGIPNVSTFLNADDCHSFHMCINGELFTFDCPHGMYFNPDISNCDAGDCPDLLPIYCPADDELLMIPHPYYCTQYYLCVGGHPVLRSCSPSYHFNFKGQTCMAHEVAECHVDHPLCPDEDDPDHPINYSHPHFCTRYFNCRDGKLLEFSCADGYYWDANDEECMVAEEAYCKASSRY